MKTAYGVQQSRQRLEREIAHFRSQVEKFSDRASPQQKRCWTRAVRCLKRRSDDLARLTFRLSDS